MARFQPSFSEKGSESGRRVHFQERYVTATLTHSYETFRTVRAMADNVIIYVDIADCIYFDKRLLSNFYYSTEYIRRPKFFPTLGCE